MIVLVNHALFDFGKVYILVNSILAAIHEKKLSRHSPCKESCEEKAHSQERKK